MDERSVRDISQLVQAKERELHEMHELRCLQLEKMIEERDGILHESTRRFNLLREDFQYNLSLLEARDKEIGRLNQLEVKLEACELERDNNAKRIEMMMLKECEREEKSQQDKIMNKKILLELQNEVEALRWTTADELKSKTREIEQSRHEVKRIQADRDENLERQRIELTELYEQMLQEREDTFLKQEENICHQVQLLEKRFQSLTTENTRLKSEGSQIQRACDKLLNEVASKDERCTQLSWQVDDLNHRAQDTEDSLYKKIHDVESENQKLQDTVEQMTIDHKRDLEKINGDLKREKEFSSLKIKHWEEQHAKSSNEIEKLTIALDCSVEKERILSKELESAREKTRHFGVKEMELNREISEIKTRVEDGEASLKKLQEALQESKMQNSQLERNYEYLENASKDQLNLATDRIQGMQAEMAVVRANLQADFIVTQEESEKAFHKQLEALRKQVKECRAEVEDKNEEYQELSSILDNERAEADAMRLRLTLHANGSNPSNLSHHQPPSHVPAPAQRTRSNDYTNVPRLNIPPGYMTQQGASASSPMFSDDFGTVSIPSSPMNFKSPFYKPGRDGGVFLGDSWSASAEHPPRETTSPSRYPQQGRHFPGALKPKSKDDLELLSLSPSSHAAEAFSVHNDHNSSTLYNDNRRLKAIIKEMRIDAEALVAREMQKAETEKDKAAEQIAKLEERLLHATLEVNKLREERRRLMDVNNELRAALQKATISSPKNSLQDTTKEENNPAKENTDDLSLYVRGYASEAPGTKGRASDRQTKSQQDALQKLKDKASASSSLSLTGHNHRGSGGGVRRYDQTAAPTRKVVNYANQNDFQQT